MNNKTFTLKKRTFILSYNLLNINIENNLYLTYVDFKYLTYVDFKFLKDIYRLNISIINKLHIRIRKFKMYPYSQYIRL